MPDPELPSATSAAYGIPVANAAGKIDPAWVAAAAPAAHAVSHQDGGSDEISVQGLSGLLADSQTPLAHAASHLVSGSDPIGGLHRSLSITYIDGTGVSGTDNTAATLKTLVLPANTLTQVGDRMRIRCYWVGTTGANLTGTCKVGTRAVSDTTDGGAATQQVNEAWIHYIDATHANIIENELGAAGSLSGPNQTGFDWAHAQNIIFEQDAAVGNHAVLWAVIVDVFPKGV